MYSILIQELNDQLNWIRSEMNEYEDFSGRWLELRAVKKELQSTIEELEFEVDCKSRKLDMVV